MEVELLLDSITDLHIVGFVVSGPLLQVLKRSGKTEFSLCTYNLRSKLKICDRPFKNSTNVIKAWLFSNSASELCVFTGLSLRTYSVVLGGPCDRLNLSINQAPSLSLLAFSDTFRHQTTQVIDRSPLNASALFDLEKSKSYSCTLPAASFASFLTGDHYVCIDAKCENVSFWNLEQARRVENGRIKRADDLIVPQRGANEGKTKEKKPISYIFDNVVIIVCEDRIFRFDLRTYAFHEITQFLNLDHSSLSEKIVSQDNEALYVLSNGRLYRIPIRRVNWSFLEVFREATRVVTLDVLCPVCTVSYRNPKVLTACGHTICDKCEERMTADDGRFQTLACPICRAVSKVPRGKRLPTNWFVKNLVEQSTTAKPPNSNFCSSCSTGVLQGLGELKKMTDEIENVTIALETSA